MPPSNILRLILQGFPACNGVAQHFSFCGWVVHVRREIGVPANLSALPPPPNYPGPVLADLPGVRFPGLSAPLMRRPSVERCPLCQTELDDLACKIDTHDLEEELKRHNAQV